MAKQELLSVGYAAIDKIDGREHFGGAAAGIAVNGKGLGLDTGLLAIFGRDEVSNRYRKYLMDLGVDLVSSLQVPEVSLPVHDLSVNHQIHGWTDNGIVDAAHRVVIDPSQIHSYDIVHLASAPVGLVHKVAQQDRLGILTYTPGPKLPLDPTYLHMDALRQSQVVFLNEAEWNATRNILNIDKPGDLIDFGPQVVVTTFGEKGSTVSYREKESVEDHIPSALQENAETTGAGDAYYLGFVVGYARKFPIRTCAEIATILAASAISDNGVIVSEMARARAVKQIEREYGIMLT